MSEPKTKPSDENVTAFLARVTDEVRRNDCFAIADLMRAASGAEPVMWGTSIIGFGRYRYRYESGREGEWPIIGFSPRKNDLTLYIMPGFSRYDEIISRLGKCKTGKSCLYIKKLADVDLDLLRELIECAVHDMAKKRVDK